MEEKLKYEKPELIRLKGSTKKNQAEGQTCIIGSGAADDCSNGSGAVVVCQTGTSAVQDCAIGTGRTG